MATEAQVLDALRHIIDPDLGRDIVSLGFVKGLTIEGGTATFTLELTTPACPVKDRFVSEAERLVGQVPGIDQVKVSLSAMAPQRKERPGANINTLEEVGAIVAVSSCKGGVGKSTIAGHLARAIQREGHRVAILDTDIYGPSFPTMFGVQNPEVRAVNERIQPIEVNGLKTMSLGYLMGDKPAVMRGPMVANYTMQILKQTEWGALDYLIIDLPPGTGDIQLTLTQQAQLDGAVIVTTPQALSLVDVARGIIMFEKVNVPVLGIVSNMAYFDCGNCSERHYPFGRSANTLHERFGVDTLAELPIIPGVSSVASRAAGEDVPAFAQLAENVHRAIGKRRIAGDNIPTVTPEKGRVRVVWPDGTEVTIANKVLRYSSQDALSVDEFTGESKLNWDDIPDDIRVEDIQQLGNYAVSIAWSDGHTAGIYSWDHMKKVAGLVEV